MSDERRDSPSPPLSRRELLVRTAIGGALAGVPFRAAGNVQAPAEALPDRERLVALAHALLPAELPDAERTGAAESLLSWLRGYREGVTMDHGYGFTRIRETDESPAGRYVRDLDAMDAAATERWGATVATAEPEQLRTLAAEAIESTAPEMDSIPSRPDAPHVAIAILSAYYRSAVATDRAYHARIRQETCRGLFTDVEGLQPWAPGVVDADREAKR